MRTTTFLPSSRIVGAGVLRVPPVMRNPKYMDQRGHEPVAFSHRHRFQPCRLLLKERRAEGFPRGAFETALRQTGSFFLMS